MPKLHLPRRTRMHIFIWKYQFVLILWSLGKRIVFFLLPEAFCGLKHAENAIAAGAPPRTPLGELTTLPRPLSRRGRGHPSPYPTPLGAFGASMLAPSASQSSCPLTPNPGDATAWSPPLFNVKLRLCRVMWMPHWAVRVLMSSF